MKRWKNNGYLFKASRDSWKGNDGPTNTEFHDERYMITVEKHRGTSTFIEYRWRISQRRDNFTPRYLSRIQLLLYLRLEIAPLSTFISSAHERDNFSLSFRSFYIYFIHFWNLSSTHSAIRKSHRWNILLATEDGRIGNFSSLKYWLSPPLPPSRLNNKFDGVKQGFFGSMKKIPFSKIWKEGYNIPSDDEWIYLPKDPPSIFSCGARISCSVRAVELCARSDIPSDCPISKQTGEKSNLYSTSSRFTSFVRQFDKILYKR